MSNISIVEYHNFNIADLKKKIDTRKSFLLNEYGTKVNNFQFAWSENIARFSCNANYNNSYYPVTGQITIDIFQLKIIISTNISGFLFNLAKPFIENKIRQEIMNIFQTPVFSQIVPNDFKANTSEPLPSLRTRKFKGKRKHKPK